ncbi:hypothetical protein [Lactococcus lactis]|uniref:hypothetical protein n=1 Tax=Lactococcus lactis TaxID=1358 RepID=UPI00071E14D4|nr:hypothetical protein [Lactococcus lactis]KST81949.1 hypothetical protein LK337_2278 [Lactococcus lactis subsp. lactis]
MIKRWYLSTPMNGKTEKEIQTALQRGVNWCIKNNDEFYYPYNPNNAEFVNGRVADPSPIKMLSKAIAPMDLCDGVLYVGSYEELRKSRGCQVEINIADLYGLEVLTID